MSKMQNLKQNVENSEFSVTIRTIAHTKSGKFCNYLPRSQKCTIMMQNVENLEFSDRIAGPLGLPSKMAKLHNAVCQKNLK